MRNNKITRTIGIIVASFFSVSFFTILLSVIIKGYENEIDSNTFSCNHKQHLIIIFGGIVFTALLFVLYDAGQKVCQYNRIQNSKHKDRYTKIIIFAVCGLILIGQMLFGYLLACKPVTDLEILNNYAKNFAKTGTWDKIQQDITTGKTDYMARYPNNAALLVILSVIYRIDYLLTGYVSRYLPVIINTLLINISIILTCLTARRILGNRKAIYTLILCAFFAPYYTYTAFFYTDSFSLPFVIGSIYTFVVAMQSENKRVKKYVFMGITGLLLLLGFKIKGSVIIILCAIVVYMLIKLKIKQFATMFLVLILAFGSCMFIYNKAMDSLNIVTKEQYYEREYPATHWVMMGLNKLGGYNKEDSKLTSSVKGKDNKIAMNIDEIKNRISEYSSKNRLNGEVDLISHIGRKMVWTWEDGTYYITHHIKKPIKKDTFLRPYLDKDGKHHYRFVFYCCAYQLMLLSLVTFSAIKDIKKKKFDEKMLLRIALMFGVVFFIVWEARSRYIFNLTPMLLILAADGLSFNPKKIFKKK